MIFQNELIVKLVNELGINRYQIIMNSIVSETNIQTDITFLSELFNSDGMKGMLNTIWLVISAMIFGGVMESIGALKKISIYLLRDQLSSELGRRYQHQLGLPLDLLIQSFFAVLQEKYLHQNHLILFARMLQFLGY